MSKRLKGLFLFLGLSVFIVSVVVWRNQFEPSEQSEPEKLLPPRPIATLAEWQIALAREGFSPGSIDGVFGEQTRQALLAFQSAHELPRSGSFDAAMAKALQIQDPVFTVLKFGEIDQSQIGPEPQSWRERGELDRLAYHSLLEMVSEQSQSHPDYIKQLNPELDWSNLEKRSEITVPRVPRPRIPWSAAYIQIRLSTKTLRVYNDANQLLFHCPVSIAQSVDKRPSGELRVTTTISEPNYTFSPEVLSSIAQREGITKKFLIQPGPNNPVGTVWIGLNLPGYGIHGTPEPEKIGRTESSGCFRLSNWNAQSLLAVARIGMPVYVEY